MKNKSKKNKKERRIEKELAYIIGFIAVLILVFFVANAIFKDFRSFEYEGLTFTKKKIGQLDVYHYYYYFVKDSKLIQYNLYLRNDPRENDIPVRGDEIQFEKNYGDTLYFSVNSTGLKECGDNSVLAVADLTRFLKENLVNVKGANIDFWEAGRVRQSWVSCESKPKNIVIEMKRGNESVIDINKRCHQIIINSCDDVIKASEKYRLQSVIDFRKNSN